MRSSLPFYSRRNVVGYCASRDCVEKRFRLEKDYQRERQIYHRLSASYFTRIPRLIKENDSQLILSMSYLNGATVLQELEKLEKCADEAGAVRLLSHVFEWLNDFYAALNADRTSEKSLTEGIAMGDVNLRNFLLVNGRICGLDFETCIVRAYADEKSELLARYLLYDPIQSAFKQAVVKVLTEQLSASEGIPPDQRAIAHYVSKISAQRNAKLKLEAHEL